jgi:SAM-dependent methyltransferase
MLEGLRKVRDRVLDNAQLRPGDQLLDIGCGDGLIGFGAVDRLPTGHVTFSDISEDLLLQCEGAAKEMGLADRCSFVIADARKLSRFDNESVDVICTRSVLIYISEKSAALSEFYRVLRPGGRLSLFEPINRFPVKLPAKFYGGLFGYDAGSIPEIVEKLNALYCPATSSKPSPIAPMVDFDERDLVSMAAAAGFGEIHLELCVDVEPGEPRSWEGFINSSPNPLQLTLSEAMHNCLTDEERCRLVACLRPQVEAGANYRRSAVAYLRASKRKAPVGSDIEVESTCYTNQRIESDAPRRSSANRWPE